MGLFLIPTTHYSPVLLRFPWPLAVPLTCCCSPISRCSPVLMLLPCHAVPLNSCYSPVLLLFPWSHAVPVISCCSPVLLLFPWTHAVPLTSTLTPIPLLFPWSHVVPLSCCCSPDLMLFPCPVAVPLISCCSPVLLLFPWHHARAHTRAQTRKHLRWKRKSWCERQRTNYWKSKTGFDWRLERPISFKRSSTSRVTWTENRLRLVTRLADCVSSPFWYDLCECLGAKCQESTNQPFHDFQFHRCRPSNGIISSCLVFFFFFFFSFFSPLTKG